MDGVGLCQIVEIFSATTEVLLGIGSIAEGELPAVVKSDGLSHTLCLHRHCHEGKHSAQHGQFLKLFHVSSGRYY